MNNEELTDILIEALEVFLNHILYVRDIYPQQIFKIRRIYNAPIYASIFPPLNSYLHNVLRAAHELHQHGELQCVQLLFHHDELPLNERYTFNFKCVDGRTSNVAAVTEAEAQSHASNDDDEFLLDFEEQLRSALYRLAERVKPLEKLPKGAKFKVLLHATQEAFVRLTQNSHFQDFPWLSDVVSHAPAAAREISLLPLAQLDALELKLHLELS